MPRHSIPRLLVALALACLAIGALGASVAAADFGIKSFDGEVTADPAGNPDTQAGSHPYAVSTDIQFNSTENPETGINEPDANVKDIHVELPPGLIGNPAATIQCSQQQFQNSQYRLPDGCPADSQVGTVTITTLNNDATFPVYNLVPHPGVPAEFGFIVLIDPVHAYATIRTGGDYGLDINLDDISQGLPITGTSLTFWGVPADPRHDPERACSTETTVCHSEGPQNAFLTLPTSCTGPQETRMTATSWQEPAAPPKTASFLTHDQSGNPLGADGCDQVPFSGKITTALDTPIADSPSGLSVDVSVPQNQSTSSIARANLKATAVTLPPGISINPSTGNGLVGCGLNEVGLDKATPSSCPDNSKIGQVEIDTPLLPSPLTGSIYLARQTENPFGSLIAIYAIAESDGVLVKLPGKIALDPASGQLVTTFDNTPQIPFSDFKLNFFGGPRSVLATPVTCGTQAVSATLTPWSGTPPVPAAATVTVNSGPNGLGCVGSAAARPFDLSLDAGTVSNAAALHSPFLVKVSRGDGQQEMSTIDTTLPKGLLASLKGVPTCSDAQAAAGSCDAASLIGSVTAGAGAGTDPFYVTDGTAYLTGPYKGAPLGLDFLVPAVAGPLNLGVVNVRAALFVDPATAQVTVKTDPLPQILEGIPLRLRSVQLKADRSGFIVNPTSCAPGQVSATVTSAFGATDLLSDRFQAAGCTALAFAPKVNAKLIGTGKALRRAGNPALQVTLKQPAGQANIADVAVTLPPAINLDQSHIKTVCTKVQFAAHDCPAGSVYGRAKALTPLLDKPISGPVYLRSSNHGLPDLVADLNGQIEIELAGRIDSKNGGIRTSFKNIPDAAVSQFVLTMNGGKKGLLVNKTNLCSQPSRRFSAKISGQNGKTADQAPVLHYSCGGK